MVIGPKLGSAQDTKPGAGTPHEDRAVLIYEELAALMNASVGECSDLADQTRDHLAKYAEVLKLIETEQKAWTKEQREAHADKYGDRIADATATLQFALVRCEHRGDPAKRPDQCAPANGATPASAKAVPLMAAIPSRWDECDCDNECPISTWDCTQYWIYCTAGDRCACCMSSLCGSTSHCKNDCNSNECCATPCGDPWVPPPPPA